MKTTGYLVSALALLIFGLPLSSQAAKYREIDTNGVKKLMDAGEVLVVNPMTPIEYAVEHIAGSVNIPIESLEQGLPPQKDRPMVFYCLGEKCVYSWRAAESAADLGYTNLYAYRGGIPAWKAAGYPINSTEQLPDVDIPMITTEQLAAKLQSEDIVVVDIIPVADADKFWIDTPKRVHIPLLEFDQKYATLPKDKDIVLLCLKGQRSAVAARLLLARGYQNVMYVEGGLQKWIMEGRPVKSAQS